MKTISDEQVIREAAKMAGIQWDAGGFLYMPWDDPPKGPLPLRSNLFGSYAKDDTDALIILAKRLTGVSTLAGLMAELKPFIENVDGNLRFLESFRSALLALLRQVVEEKLK